MGAMDTAMKVGNGLFMLDGAKEGKVKFNKELSENAPLNEYDETLGNDIVKVKKDFMGNTNALNNTREAHEILDNLYQEKLAYGDDWGDDYEDDDDDDRRDKDEFKSYYKDHNSRNFNNNDNDKSFDYLPYAVLGSAAVGLGAYQAYKSGNIMAPIQTAGKAAKKGFQKGMMSGPKNLIGKNKVGKIFMKSLKEANKNVGNMEKQWAKENKSQFPKATFPTMHIGNAAGLGLIGGLTYAGYKASNNGYNKRASDTIDEIYKEAASITRFENKKEMAKTLFKEDFLQNGLRSIPFAAVPLGISYTMNKNLKSGNLEKVRGNKDDLGNNDRIVMDVPIEALNNRRKRASEEIDEMLQEKVAYEPIKMRDWAKYQLPREVVRATSWTLFPATAIALTGRNLRDMGQKIHRKDGKEIGPVEPGKARITIETGRSNSNYDYKMASELIDEIYKQAANNFSSDIEKGFVNQITKETDATDTIVPNLNKRFYQGKKKEQRRLK